MRKLLSLGVLLSVLCAVVSYVTCRPITPVEVYPTRRVVSPSVYHFSDLPREVYYGRVLAGQIVTVSYPFRLQDTADPRVWHFHPGTTNVPYTHRIVFASPQYDLRCPVTVTGTVQGIDTDGRVRLSNIPGSVVIRGAFLSPTKP